MDDKNRNGYTLDDFTEALIGAVSVLLFMFVVKTSSGQIINFKIGILITVVWLYLMYYGIKKMGYNDDYALTHTVFDFIICISVASMFAIMFGQATLAGLMGLQIFGNMIIILSWAAVPVAVSFDLHGCKNIIRTKFIAAPR